MEECARDHTPPGCSLGRLYSEECWCQISRDGLIFLFHGTLLDKMKLQVHLSVSESFARIEMDWLGL
jgi:hypothetical protein